MAVIVAIVTSFIIGYCVGYTQHNRDEMSDGPNATYSIVQYENGLTNSKGYNMEIHTMSCYVTNDEHCGGLNIKSSGNEIKKGE